MGDHLQFAKLGRAESPDKTHADMGRPCKDHTDKLSTVSYENHFKIDSQPFIQVLGAQALNPRQTKVLALNEANPVPHEVPQCHL